MFLYIPFKWLQKWEPCLFEYMWICPKVGWMLDVRLLISYCEYNYKFISKPK